MKLEARCQDRGEIALDDRRRFPSFCFPIEAYLRTWESWRIAQIEQRCERGECCRSPWHIEEQNGRGAASCSHPPTTPKSSLDFHFRLAFIRACPAQKHAKMRLQGVRPTKAVRLQLAGCSNPPRIRLQESVRSCRARRGTTPHLTTGPPCARCTSPEELSVASNYS